MFLATLFLYITLYGGCMAVRRKGGPWVITQDKLPDGTPIVQIEHHRILSNGPVTLRFPGEVAPARFTNHPLQRIYSQPNTNILPYGPVVFLDTTFLPGNVTLDVFGHLVEMVPRTLYLDGKDVGWVAGTNIVLSPTNKLPVEARPKPKKR
jgi:hypothetical protein